MLRRYPGGYVVEPRTQRVDSAWNEIRGFLECDRGAATRIWHGTLSRGTRGVSDDRSPGWGRATGRRARSQAAAPVCVAVLWESRMK
eukprot:2713235-Pleurochrysis_carterae.AAC.1